MTYPIAGASRPPGRLARLGGVRRLPLWQPLAGRDFRLVWIGQSASFLGDQFQFVALTWLTLQITGSGLALGTVLMAAAVPRAVFMVVGGAMTDRTSPRTLMFLSTAARSVLVGALAALVLTDAVRLWHLYVLGALFGVIDAFFFPAARTIVPSLVKEDQLPAGNALLQGTAHLTLLVGPAPAGLLIAAAGTGPTFAATAATFAIGAVVLGMVRERTVEAASQPGQEREGKTHDDGLAATILAGLRYAWGAPVFRAILVMIAAVDFSFVGPFDVGLASLAHSRFPEGAAALGTILSAFGAGALLGTAAGGSIRRVPRRGPTMGATVGAMGLLLAVLGLAPTTLVAAALVGTMGFGSGFVNVVMMSWLQERTEPGMLGRMSSLLMLASQGLAPISFAIAGALVDVYPALVFAAAGGIVVAATAGSFASRSLRTID